MASRKKLSKGSKIRISRGSLKGSFIDFPEVDDLRPTLNKIREAVFNMVVQYVSTHGFVDVFSGSGGMAFEAFSCGFSPIALSESHRGAFESLIANARRLRVSFDIVEKDAMTLLHSLAAFIENRSNGRASNEVAVSEKRLEFPLVFYIDPPFRKPEVRDEVLGLIARLFSGASQSLVILEQPKGSVLPEYSGLVRLQTRVYGSNQVVLFAFSDSNP